MRLLHAHERPELCAGGTLGSLEVLAAAGIIDGDEARGLEEDYLFLRRVEHFLQVYEDRQVHRLPRDPVELRALARRILGNAASADDLAADIAARSRRVRERFDRFAGEDR
jgi:glutamate-ammonia-ligase adenylyltransferase